MLVSYLTLDMQHLDITEYSYFYYVHSFFFEYGVEQVALTLDPNIYLTNLSSLSLYLLLITRKVINKIIPHLRLMLMLPLAIPRKVRNRKRPTGLEHERYRAFGDSRLRRDLVAGFFEFFVCHAMGDHYSMVRWNALEVHRQQGGRRGGAYCHIQTKHSPA